ncbi:hypothetical protein GUJ93_ZPchr0006g45236 [Zizania palustris]|uniref:Fucosyltransferase n=1 Tax=Zizania palustris TaxID=103762 RepID=A0A8J5TGX7_ZIZPA|nr:hypothetical protein GUJ93_ZPchr0006g45236 [Zizania palustris]
METESKFDLLLQKMEDLLSLKASVETWMPDVERRIENLQATVDKLQVKVEKMEGVKESEEDRGIPSVEFVTLFLNPVYKEELELMFPRKDSVFYLLSRYLFHPSNDVWGMVTRFYDSYLKNVDERLGIQIRVFDGDEPFQHIMDQILLCASQEHLLPGVVSGGGGGAPPPITPAAAARSKAVLMTGLNSWYHDNIREMYWRSPSVTGEVVSVHQPSHEEHQHFFRSIHDMKALAEMYLLSLTDKIVTSGWSTFGYVGSGLGGLRPYIMIKLENHKVPNPPCKKSMSMEPCNHGPPYFECTKKEIDKVLDTGSLVPHVRSCEDMPWGRKLTDSIS